MHYFLSAMSYHIINITTILGRVYFGGSVTNNCYSCASGHNYELTWTNTINWFLSVYHILGTFDNTGLSLSN